MPVHTKPSMLPPAVLPAMATEPKLFTVDWMSTLEMEKVAPWMPAGTPILVIIHSLWRVMRSCFKMHLVGPFAAHEAQQHQHRGDGLGNHRGDGHALYPHAQDDDEEQVQHHVDDAGEEQEVQGPLGVPHRPEDGRAEVIQHHHGHAAEVDAHVQHRLVDDVLGGAHHLQQGPGQGDAHEDEEHAAD